MGEQLWRDYHWTVWYFRTQASLSGSHGVEQDTASIDASRDIDEIRRIALERLYKYLDETICSNADKVNADYFTDDQLAALPGQMKAISFQVRFTLVIFFSQLNSIRPVYEIALRTGRYSSGMLLHMFNVTVAGADPDTNWLDFSSNVLNHLRPLARPVFPFALVTAAGTEAPSSSQALVVSGSRQVAGQIDPTDMPERDRQPSEEVD